MEQKRFKAAGKAVFAVAAGALVFRIIAYFVYSSIDLSGAIGEVVLELIFTLPVQVLVCFFIPLLILQACQDKTPRQVFADSGFKKTKLSVLLLAAVLGFSALFVSQIIGSIWLGILTLFGYTYNPSPMEFTANFSLIYFLASLFFTAVLPAICEEFAMRGTFLTAIRGSSRFDYTAIIIIAISFGLFHQNIVQLFYTAFFGAAMGYVVIRTKSIYPAIIAHFVNNAMVVVFSYADNYGWFADPTYFLTANLGFFGFLLTGALGVGLAFLAIFGINRITKSTAPAPLTQIYKPTARDKAFYIGAIVITALSTIFTFALGF